MSKFWDKVHKCKHDNLSPNYLENIYCGTPYCSGYETHCLDCGVYISECQCGFENGLSGWPSKKYKAHDKKKRKEK